VDCASNDPEAIFRKFFDKVEERRLARWNVLSFARELGEPILRLASALTMGTVPWASATGQAVAAVFPKVATTPYSSAASERFAKLITSGRWKRNVLFLVDNAQELKPQSLHILNTTFAARYDHVQFVLAYINDKSTGDGWGEFRDRLVGFGLDLHINDFPAPDGEFVAELAAWFRVSLSAEEREGLLRATQRRASRLIAAFTGASAGASHLNAIEREVLRYLVVAEQPLQRDDIRTLVLQSPRIAATEAVVLKALDALARDGLVTPDQTLARSRCRPRSWPRSCCTRIGRGGGTRSHRGTGALSLLQSRRCGA